MPAPKRNKGGTFVTIPMAMGELNMCRASVVKLAREASALYRYGNAQRINIQKLKDYFVKEYAE